MPRLDPDRLLPLDDRSRSLGRELYESVAARPIISPHGHVDPRWLAEDLAFGNPAELFVIPDHYVFRMLHSQGVPLADLGVARVDGEPVETDPERIWQRFAEHYPLLRATPSALWLDHVFESVFGIDEPFNADSAKDFYQHIARCLAEPAFRPRALFERFNIEVLATTDAATDDLHWHRQLAEDEWSGRVVCTYRPDAVVDPEHPEFTASVRRLGELTGCDTSTWPGYLEAHRRRRLEFKALGATATDHGHPSARTAWLSDSRCRELLNKALAGRCDASDAEWFRAHLLTEMALMSVEDGLVMQIHAGSHRNHSSAMLARFGRDKGFDIPQRTDYVESLQPLLDKVGLNPDVTVILFTLDDSTWARELAPLAGVYPALRLGPPWWFFDSPEGMRRFREHTSETCGIYNTVGFNDDTRAFCSIPARHDMARRVDSAWLATLVSSGRLNRDDAFDMAECLTVSLARRAYRL